MDDSNHLASNFSKYSSVLSVILILLGFSVEFGWLIDNVLLKSIFPGIVSMNPLTALCFILIGIYIYIISRKKINKNLSTLLGFIALFVFVVGYLRFISILTGFDFHHDQIIFHDKMVAVTNFSRNRIAPNTALNFMLIGIAFALLCVKKYYKIAHFFLFTTFMISLLAILGYSYSVKNLYGFLSYTPMALNTAIAFFTTSVGALFATSDKGLIKNILSPNIGGVTARRLIPGVIIIPALLGYIRLLGQQAGYYNTEYGTSILIISVIVVFMVLIYMLAKLLNQKDILAVLKTKQLTEANIRDEATMQSMGEGLVATDEHSRILKVNRKAEEMLGFDQKELIGRWIIGAFAIYDEAGSPLNPKNHPMIKAMDTGSLIYTNLQFARKDFTKFTASVAVSPILFGNKPIGAIIVFRDVTIEMEIDRMKSEFISLASHQLRTPLSAMKWNLEALVGKKTGKLNTDQKEYIKDINSSNERMIELVNSLLNVSRLESGRIIIDPAPSELGQLILDVKKDLRAKIEEKKQNLTVKVDAGLGKVNLDQKLIRQVYMNLLTNSIKYTPANGKISVQVSIKGNEIISMVKDNGYGIPKKEHYKVFQKFYRGENIVKIVADGNGLGMYLAKSIIESSNGKIWFESEEGKGTTFWFSLPLIGMISKKGEVSMG